MEHVIDANAVSPRWDRDTEPTLRIETVTWCARPGDGRQRARSGKATRYADTTSTSTRIYRLLGPMFVDGARPGDTLARGDPGDDARASGAGAAIEPGLGLLPEDFPEPFVKTFDLRDGKTVQRVPAGEIPLAPFLGTMGTHPDSPASALVSAAQGGGNIDTRHLTAGSTLWLPIWCEGALFSCGDPHGVQGDGEVCLAALECDMQATLRFTVERADDRRAGRDPLKPSAR